jgi:dipeptidyl-peptidase-4
MRLPLSTILFFFLFVAKLSAQPQKGLRWSNNGESYYKSSDKGIIKVSLPSFSETIIVTPQQLVPEGQTSPLKVRNFVLSEDGKKLLLYTNSKRVWRYETRGDYWVWDAEKNSIVQLGAHMPSSSLMFAKFSPDGSKVAYVSGHNLYVYDLTTGVQRALTTDGSDRLINGTFDWVYEEELDCRDGFRWSPDGKSIAYWKIDASKIRNFLMINNTDSIYAYNVPVEYPKTGERPSPAFVYTVEIASGKTTKMEIPGDPANHYIPRMEWAANSSQLVIQQLNRKQNESKVMYCNAMTGAADIIYTETADSWIDVKARWAESPTGWDWIKQGTCYLWVSEKDGWRHIYEVSRDGKKERLITKGNYDIISIKAWDEKSGFIYFDASPDNATQSYLYRIQIEGNKPAERLSPSEESGTHEYDISPNGKYARHEWSSLASEPVSEWVRLPDHSSFRKEEAVSYPTDPARIFQITTADGVTMDGYIVLPTNFDSTKKYPVVFYVYSEPAATTVSDQYGAAGNFLYNGDMASDGYIQISLDGRGTPAPKGAAWRHAIYRQIGRVNIRDQAMAAKEILKWPYVDSERVAVWGWSGGGSATLNLLFQYPEIYKTGIAIAALTNLLTYDNIYTERYMGLPQENKADYEAGSPITHVGNFKGHLLYIHGTGDDNVHYQNAEMLLNEVIRQNKLIDFMAYPNRTHSISEGKGTFQHLSNLYTNYLRKWCPPGGR